MVSPGVNRMSVGPRVGSSQLICSWSRYQGEIECEETGKMEQGGGQDVDGADSAIFDNGPIPIPLRMDGRTGDQCFSDGPNN